MMITRLLPDLREYPQFCPTHDHHSKRTASLCAFSLPQHQTHQHYAVSQRVYSWKHIQYHSSEPLCGTIHGEYPAGSDHCNEEVLPCNQLLYDLYSVCKTTTLLDRQSSVY